MYEYDKYRQVSTEAWSSDSLLSSPLTSSRTSMYTNTTLAGFMKATSYKSRVVMLVSSGVRESSKLKDIKNV